MNRHRAIDESIQPEPHGRLDITAMDRDEDRALGEAQVRETTRYGVRWFILPLAVLGSVGQSILWLSASNIRQMPLAGSLIPILGFVLLVLFVAVINPALRLWQRRGGPRPLSRAELMTLFAAMLVTSGISTYGLVEQLVPLIPAPFNPNWNTPQRGWDERFIPTLNPNLYITDPAVIQQYREGIPAPPGLRGWWPTLKFSFYILGQIPWVAWLKPLMYWFVFVAAAYGLFVSLSYVVLPFWSRREKLIFPLARLPESLLPEPDRPAGAIPRVFTTFGFWIGFGLSFLVLGWNGSVQSGWFGDGLGQIPLGMASYRVDVMLKDTLFQGMSHSIALLLLFTATGLAFFLPLEMSFSIWFYYLAGRGVLLIGSWLGYGAYASDFPTNFLWLSNPVSAQGGGGMFMFSAISLGRCLLEYRYLAFGKQKGQKVRIALPVLGLFASMLVLTLWLSWNNLGFWWALLFVTVLTLLTLGIMRMVAEGGIYWFQAHTGFFHIYKMFGLGSVLPAAVIAPILPIYSVFFLDLKAFVAPNILNAAKLREDVGGSRLKYHVTILASVVSTVVISVFYSIYLAYQRGADRMHYWWYSLCPQLILDTSRDTLRKAPQFEPVTVTWFCFGAAWVAASFVIRRTVFWFPHPLGYILLINPLMDQLWLSFFVAWLVKKLIVKYGGKETFERASVVVIGMIVGELLAIALWSAIALGGGLWIQNITLDKYGP